MKKKLESFFSPEARAARRAARLSKTAQLSGSFTGTKHFEGESQRITTQNAGTKAVELVRDILNNFNLPITPKLSYSGLRGGRTAANSSRLEDGVITVHASLRTFSNIQIGFDVPVEIHNGHMLEPSVVVHDGSPRVIAQSTFNDIVARNSVRDPAPVREMYSQPFDKQMANDLYSHRQTRTRHDRGMFSVGANRRNLVAAIRGTAIAAQQNQPKFQPGASVIRTDANGAPVDGVWEVVGAEPDNGTFWYALRPADEAAQVVPPNGNGPDDWYSWENELSPADDGEHSADVPVRSPGEQAVIDGQGTSQDEGNGTLDEYLKTAQSQPYSVTQPLPQLKVPYHPGYGGYGNTGVPQGERATRSLKSPAQQEVGNTSVPQPTKQMQPAQQPAQQGKNVAQQLGQMAQELGQISQELSQQRTANKYIKEQGGKWVIIQKGTGKVLSHHDSKEKAEAAFRGMEMHKHSAVDIEAAKQKGIPKPPKPPKSVKPNLMKPPKPPAKPDTKRLCSKCSHSPCICPNKRKKKADDAMSPFQPSKEFYEGDVALRSPQVENTPACVKMLGHECPSCELGLGADMCLEKNNLGTDKAMTVHTTGGPISQLPSSDVPLKGPVSANVYRPIQASDMVQKIKAEVQSMRGQGLSSIDIRQALFTKYGPELAASALDDNE